MDTNFDTQLLWQSPRVASTHLYRVIREHLGSPELLHCRLATAYASWGGLSLVSDAVEEFLDQGKTLHTVFGTANGITTPDALLYAWYLKRRFRRGIQARVFDWEYGNSEFHPKYYEFVYPDRRVCIVGSSNLTGGGFARNHELSAVVTSRIDAPINRRSNRWWKQLVSGSHEVTPKLIRDMSQRNELGTEDGDRKRIKGQKFIDVKLPRAKKPLFEHLVKAEPVPKLRHEVFADADTLSEKPTRLYLEILRHETGGGHQIQLPVATLGAFFGLGQGGSEEVTFRFPGSNQPTRVQLTHFGNNTHRVRLLPLRDLPRPGIVVFKRTTHPNVFDCEPIASTRYKSVLEKKCVEQTREDSRRWGLQ